MLESQLKYYNGRSDLNLLELQGSAEKGTVRVSVNLLPNPGNP